MANPANMEKYFTPKTILEAVEIATDNIGFLFISGGTDIMPNKQQGNLEFTCLIDLGNIPEMQSTKLEGDNYVIGASVKLSEIIADGYIIENFKALVDAAKSVASPLIRNQATIGGNILCENRCVFYNQSELWREAAGYCLKCGGGICIATGGKKSCLSKFVSDMAPALICLNAKVVLVDQDSENTIPLEELYTGDGIDSKKIKNGTILKSILLPINQGIRASFKKLRQRKALEFTSLTVAVSVDSSGTVIIAASGVAPTPLVVKASKTDPFDSIYKEVNKKSRIINNDILDRQYRKSMLKVYLHECLKEIDIQ